LIFDEVITGFRAAPGGAQEVFGIRADLGTYGKVVGGGMPIGVIAGKKEFMDALDGGFWQYGDNSVPEAGVTYFAGTFVRHPFALAAADAALRHMLKRGPALQQQLNDHTQRLAEAVNGHCEQLGVPFHIVHFGSLFKPKVDADLNNADLIYFMMRHKGIHMYDGFPCFLTEAHSSEDVDAIVRAFKEVLTELCSLGFLPSQDKAAVKVVAAHTNGNGSHTNGNGTPNYDPAHPPVAGALLGKNPDGSPGWFLPDPGRPGKYLKVNMN
jgi:glutamate-1-semialdehyde aminotransferase